MAVVMCCTFWTALAFRRTSPAKRGRQGHRSRRAAALARPVMKRRSVVSCLGLHQHSGLGAPAAQLARRHEVAVRLYDPMEVDLPISAHCHAGRDRRQLTVDTHDRVSAALRRCGREVERRATLAEAGVDCLELATDEPLDAAALHAAARRSQLAAGACGIVAGLHPVDPMESTALTFLWPRLSGCWRLPWRRFMGRGAAPPAQAAVREPESGPRRGSLAPVFRLCYGSSH
jgi:hypothetical protein